MPSAADAETLLELLADARAIPAGAFVRASERPDASDAPRGAVPSTIVSIPDATVSLVAASDEQWADYRR
jgi:hypothetical protein